MTECESREQDGGASEAPTPRRTSSAPFRRIGAYLTSHALIGDLSGGALSGFISITYGSSYAALLFSGPLEGYLPYGVAVTLITAILGALIVSLISSLYFSVAGPDSNTTSVLSIMLAALATQLNEAGLGGLVLPHVMLALFISTLATGAMLYLLGSFRMGRWVRFVPFPVMGGFLAATGWLMTSGALGIIANTPLTLAGLNRLLDQGPSPQLLVAVAMAALFFAVMKRSRHPLALPLLLVVDIAAVYVGLAVSGVDLATARADGWLFQGLTDIRVFSPWELLSVQDLHWKLLLSHAGEMAAVMMVAAITILLCATGMEVATGQDMDLDRELRGHGLANLVTALAGGYLALLSPGRSLTILRAGAVTRVSGLIVAALCAAVLFVAPTLVGYLPKIVLGAFLLSLGASLMHEWLVESWSRLLTREYLLIILILVVTVLFGFTVGMLAGIIGACLDFAINYSRVDVVQHDLSGVEFRSTFQRSEEEQAVLDQQGEAIRVIVFRGFIFFGMASPLLDRIRHDLAVRHVMRFLILDFKEVDGVDTSAAMTFFKVRQIAERAGVAVVFTGLTPRIRRVLTSAGSLRLQKKDIFPTLDAAMEWAEEQILATFEGRMDDQFPMLNEWLLTGLGDGIAVEFLKTYLQPFYLDSGELLFRRGTAATMLYLVDSGRVSVMVEDENGAPRRVARLVGGAMVGEEDLYTSGTHQATAIADVPSVVYGLPNDSMEQLNIDHPRLAARFHAIILRLMAKRLRLSQNESAMLRREAASRRSLKRA